MRPALKPFNTAASCLLIFFMAVATIMNGCATVPGVSERVELEDEKKAWSSQLSWAYIKQINNPSRVAIFRAVNPRLADIVSAADLDFSRQLDLASSSALHHGSVSGLLETIRKDVAIAIRNEEQYRNGTESGLILLGKLIGPDGRPIESTSKSSLEIERFMGEFLKNEGRRGRWSYLAMTPKEAAALAQSAGAGGGSAIQNGGRTFIYDTENILVLNLTINAVENAARHSVEYEVVGEIASPSTRTSSPIDRASIRYFYQPFQGEWITEEEEMARRSETADPNTTHLKK